MVDVIPNLKINQVVVEAARPQEKKAAGGGATAVEVLALGDKAAIVTTANEGLQEKGDARRALLIIREFKNVKDARGQRALESHLKVLKESKDPADRALALDFEIARQRLELSSEKEETRKTEQTASIAKLEEERGKIPGNPPNAFEEMVVRMTGISPEDAKTDSLGSVLVMFENVKGNKKADGAFFKHLQEKGFSGEELGVAKDILCIMRGEQTKMEKTRNFAVKTGGLMAALTLLMAWLASKEKQGAGAMG